MTNEERIIDILETSFQPLNCFVEFTPFKMAVNFQIRDEEDTEIYTLNGMKLQDPVNISKLESIISEVRGHIEAKGIKLHPMKPLLP